MRPTRCQTNRARGLALVAILSSTAVTTTARQAAAEEVSPTGKGIVGGALLGAEVVTMTEAIIGVESPWAYVIGGVVGAGGGGVGGYFVEQATSDGRPANFMLAGGLALVIPAIVLTLNATRFKPTEGAVEDRAPTNAPPADPGQPGGSSVVGVGGSVPVPAPAPAPAAAPAPTPAPTTPPSTSPGAPAPPPQSMFDVHEGQFRLGVPVPQVRPMVSLREMKELGVPQQTEVRMPVVKVVF